MGLCVKQIASNFFVLISTTQKLIFLAFPELCVTRCCITLAYRGTLGCNDKWRRQQRESVTGFGKLFVYTRYRMVSKIVIAGRSALWKPSRLL